MKHIINTRQTTPISITPPYAGHANDVILEGGGGLVTYMWSARDACWRVISLARAHLKRGQIFSGTFTGSYIGNFSGTFTGSIANISGRNIIINGAMEIDQRKEGVSLSIAADELMSLDRWRTRRVAAGGTYSVQRSTTAPAGFLNSALLTVTSADASVAAGDYYAFIQRIEGTHMRGLDFGLSTAKTITVSFWVRSSVTGAFSFALTNATGTRGFPAQYTISSANTWEYKTITIPGETTGTWVTTVADSMQIWFGLGIGTTYTEPATGAWSSVSNALGADSSVNWISTNAATFYLTGVQLEVGSVATPFDRRPFAVELELCQRYYEKSYNVGTLTGSNTAVGISMGLGGNTVYIGGVSGQFKVSKRTTPTVSLFSHGGTAGIWSVYGGASTAAATADAPCEKGFAGVSSTGLTAGELYYGHWAADIEL
jgi:hypothetical protein